MENVLDDSGDELNALFSINSLDGKFGLILESRGGAKGKANERNTDYTTALETIIRRLCSKGTHEIEIFLASAKALGEFLSPERQIRVDRQTRVNLRKSDSRVTRLAIGRAVASWGQASGTTGGNQTKRILLVDPENKTNWYKIARPAKRGVSISEEELDEVRNEADFDDEEDEREKALRSIALRRGQQKFRAQLLAAYEGKCCVTGCEITSILEAAHINPYKGKKSNRVANGLLLRADIHTLFDLGLLNITDAYSVLVSSQIIDSEYHGLHGKEITLPKNKNHAPNPNALRNRLTQT